MAESTASTETEPEPVRAIIRLSLAAGALYYAGHAGYVVTDWEPSALLPLVALVGVLLGRTAVRDLWHCGTCKQAVLATRCPDCGTRLLDRSAALWLSGVYVLVVPVGALVGLLAVVLLHDALVPALAWLPGVGWYHAQDVTNFGFAGAAYLAYVVASATLAGGLALSLRTLYAGVGSLTRP